MLIEKIETRTDFPDDYPTRYSRQGNITELVMMKRMNRSATIKKINNELYQVMSTGEVKEYESQGETRADNMQGVRRTIARLRAIINANIIEAQNCAFATFTYARNMTDREQLYIDRKNFWRRFCAYCKRNGIPIPEYISVLEPQGRGAFHLHEIYIWKTKAPFIPNEELWRCWSPDGILKGQDFTKIKSVNNCDNVGAYFSAYLADMPFDEYDKLSDEEKPEIALDVQEKDFEDEQGHKKLKKFVKGGRLHLYPSGIKIYRTSRGIKIPEFDYIDYKKAKEKVSGATETFSNTILLSDEKRDFKNEITKVYYNSKRANSQNDNIIAE